MKKSLKYISVSAAICTIISALVGIFYSFGGEVRTVTNIYGEEITLFGDGIYANNTIFKVGGTKGTDIAIIIVSIVLLITIFYLKNRPYAPFLQAGFLSCILYSTTCLIMGVSFNRLYLLYLIQFGLSLFGFILSIINLIKVGKFHKSIYEKSLKGTAIFMIISGCSVLVWLTLVIPVIITGDLTGFVEIYTTEPTYTLDLAIILPACVFSGISMLQKKEIGYKLASVLFTLLTCVGVCVVFQTIMQVSLGIQLNIGEIIGMVTSFVLLGIIAITLNIRLLKYAR